MGLTDIVEGHVNELINKNEDLSEMRMKICKACPLYKDDLFAGPMCNNKLYLNTTNLTDVSREPRIGYQKGCGCRLNAKTRLEHRHCPVKKW